MCRHAWVVGPGQEGIGTETPVGSVPQIALTEVEVDSLKIGITLLLIVAVAVGCSDAIPSTEISAVVAPHFSHGGLETGDPVAGADLRLYKGDVIVLETALDDTGAVAVSPEPGTYDVQVSLSSTDDPGCFWGETIFTVAFPSDPLTIEVGYICAGQ